MLQFLKVGIWLDNLVHIDIFRKLMKFMQKWKSLSDKVSSPKEFFHQRQNSKRNIMKFIGHVTSRNHIDRGMCDFAIRHDATGHVEKNLWRF